MIDGRWQLDRDRSNILVSFRLGRRVHRITFETSALHESDTFARGFDHDEYQSGEELCESCGGPLVGDSASWTSVCDLCAGSRSRVHETTTRVVPLWDTPEQ